MTAHSLTISSLSPEQTCQLARSFASWLVSGDVLLLSGEVGAGKTHFARCLIRESLQAIEDVPSPTYTLVQTYLGHKSELWHADLYRLTDASEVEELGLLQAFNDAICLVEWPDRLGELAPSSALSISIEPGSNDEARQIHLSWTAQRWTECLKELVDA